MSGRLHVEFATLRRGPRSGIATAAVGAAIAPIAAQNACGCRLLIGVTSAGEITPIGLTPRTAAKKAAARPQQKLAQHVI
jgi:hypothetical protein